MKEDEDEDEEFSGVLAESFSVDDDDGVSFLIREAMKALRTRSRKPMALKMR